ncbi:MAG: glycosyltransferase family 39 protein [Thermoproteota archaeon]|jgi:4-amino-4-deoxy-L-arabinose transferase-like glycosyltransferase|nr:glycosyltransferase family 39 protein [Thermoproteota archaeon]
MQLVKSLGDKKFIITTIIILAAFLRLYNLMLKPPFIPDEEVYFRTAEYYAFGKTNPLYTQLVGDTVLISQPNHVNYEHPLLGKLIFAFSLRLFGDSLFSARLISALFNIVLVYISYLIAKKIVREDKALLFSFLISIDPLNVSLSRSAMLDSFCLFFFASGILAYLYARDKNLGFILLSVFFGLAIAVKLTMLPLIITLILFSIFEIKRNKILSIPLSLSIVFLVFIITYLPYFYLSTNEKILPQEYHHLDYGTHNWNDFINLLNWIFLYNFYWHLEKNFYPYLFENPFFYTIQQNGAYQMFNANPLIVYAGIALLLIYPYYNTYIKKINENYRMLLWLFLPQAILLFIRGLAWYLIIFDYLSLLIMFTFSPKHGTVSEFFYLLYLLLVFVVDTILLVAYFLF